MKGLSNRQTRIQPNRWKERSQASPSQRKGSKTAKLAASKRVARPGKSGSKG